MDKRFFAPFKMNKDEYNQYSNVLTSYEQTMTDEELEVWGMIEDGIAKRFVYDERYDDIDYFLQGQVLPEKVNNAFSINTGNNEALIIMNSKAALFDVRAINVELKPKNYNLDAASLNYAAEGEAKQRLYNQFNRVINESYFTNPKFSFVISDAIKYSRGYPMSITMIGWDDNATLGASTNVKGDITCENVPVKNFFWDPAANDIDNCEFVFVSKILPYFRLSKFVKGLNQSRHDLLDAFYVINNSQAVATEGTSDVRSNQTLITNGSLELISLFKREDKKVKVYYVLGRKYIIGTQTYDIPYLPFAILKEQEAPDSFPGISSVMLAMPSIKQKYFIDQICNNIALMQKDPIIFLDNASGVDGKQIVDWQTNQRGKVCGTNVNPTQTAYLMPSPTISQDLLTWRQIIEQEINKAIGSSDVSNGIGLDSKLSGAAVNNAVAQATIKENTSVVELEKYLVRFTRIVLALLANKIPKQASNDIVYRAKAFNVNDPTDPYDLITFHQEDFEVMDLIEMDININAELLRTSKKQQQLQDLMQLYQIEMQYNKGQANFVTIATMVEQLNLPNKYEILQRFKDLEQNNKLQKSVMLVQGIQQLMQAPQYQNIELQDAVAQILQVLDQPNGEEQLAMFMQQLQQQQAQEQEQGQEIQNQAQLMQLAGLLQGQGE